MLDHGLSYHFSLHVCLFSVLLILLPSPATAFHISASPHHPPCRSFFAPSFPLRLSPHYPFSSSITHDAQVQPTAPICPDSELCRKQFPLLRGPSRTGLRQIGHDGKSRHLRNAAAVENRAGAAQRTNNHTSSHRYSKDNKEIHKIL